MAKRSKNKASGVIWLVALLCIVCLLYEPLARRMGVDTEKEGITALLGKLSERAAQRADSLLADTLAVQSAQPAVGKEQTEAPKAPVTVPSASRKAPAAKGSSASKMPTGETLLRPAPMKKGTPERILRRRGYITSYNSYTKLPNWVAWELNREKLVERESRTDKFLPDPDLSPAEAVTTDDYKRSGWDRGHMCPAGDNRWHWRAMQESFYMTNICPQNHNLNRGDWKELEEACRAWAQCEAPHHRPRPRRHRARSLLQGGALPGRAAPQGHRLHFQECLRKPSVGQVCQLGGRGGAHHGHRLLSRLARRGGARGRSPARPRTVGTDRVQRPVIRCISVCR